MNAAPSLLFAVLTVSVVPAANAQPPNFRTRRDGPAQTNNRRLRSELDRYDHVDRLFDRLDEDKDGKPEFAGTVPSTGTLLAPLTEAVIHPPTWPKGGEAKNKKGIAKEVKTPHTIKVDGNVVKTVTMDKAQTVAL